MKPKTKAKTVKLYNPITNDEWWCHDYNDVQVIDGVEFIQVTRWAQDRAYLMRKDSLKKVETPR